MRFDSPAADRITAAVFFALGAAMLYGGYVMDRLEIRQIHPASIPGLVPMMLGVALMVCAGALFRSASAGHEGEGGGESWSSLGVAAAWSMVYALGLISRMPFAVATALYIAGFVLYFRWRERRTRAFGIGTVLFAAGFGVVTSVAVSALFRYGFLVRLP